LGGLRNQFAFQDAPTPGFARQHGLRLTRPGQLVLLDNLGDPAASQAERYEYDAATRTARLVGSYGPSPVVIALLGGTTQDLPGGRTLVAFGNGGRVEEYDGSGAVVWRIEGNSGYIFRAQRIGSLYRPASARRASKPVHLRQPLAHAVPRFPSGSDVLQDACRGPSRRFSARIDR